MNQQVLWLDIWLLIQVLLVASKLALNCLNFFMNFFLAKKRSLIMKNQTKKFHWIWFLVDWLCESIRALLDCFSWKNSQHSQALLLSFNKDQLYWVLFVYQNSWFLVAALLDRILLIILCVFFIQEFFFQNWILNGFNSCFLFWR